MLFVAWQARKEVFLLVFVSLQMRYSSQILKVGLLQGIGRGVSPPLIIMCCDKMLEWRSALGIGGAAVRLVLAPKR